MSKNTNELNTRAPGRFGLDVSTLGSPMEARILGYEHAGPAVIRKKETRPEAADYGRSKLRNQRRIDFLRSTGAGNGLTVRLVRHSHRKRGETDRPRLRSTAPALDSTGISSSSASRVLALFAVGDVYVSFAKKTLTLHLVRGEGRERYIGCNLMQRKALASSHQHFKCGSTFLELGTALRMGVAIGSREGCVEVPGSMVEINEPLLRQVIRHSGKSNYSLATVICRIPSSPAHWPITHFAPAALRVTTASRSDGRRRKTTRGGIVQVEADCRAHVISVRKLGSCGM